MPQVKTAEEATQIAVEFIRRYKLLATPLSAKRTDDVWLVEIDVGVFALIKGWVKIEAGTGTILEYEFPR